MEEWGLALEGEVENLSVRNRIVLKMGKGTGGGGEGGVCGCVVG